MPAISSLYAALTAVSAAKSCTSCNSSSARGMCRPSSQIRAVDSASDTQDLTTNSSRAGGSSTPRWARICSQAACRTPSTIAFAVDEPTAGPPRISAAKPGPCSSTKSKNRPITRNSRAPSGPSRGSRNRVASSSAARRSAASYRLCLPGK